MMEPRKGALPLPRASGRCRLGQGTFVGAPDNDGNAPKPVIAGATKLLGWLTRKLRNSHTYAAFLNRDAVPDLRLLTAPRAAVAANDRRKFRIAERRPGVRCL